MNRAEIPGAVGVARPSLHWGMRRDREVLWYGWAFGLTLLLGSPVTGLRPLEAQDSSVPTMGARAFLGDWSIVLQGSRDSVLMRIALVDDGGQVIGHVMDPDGRLILVEEIMWVGPDLSLGFRMEFEGQAAQVDVRLELEEDGLAVTLQGGGGAFIATGRGSLRGATGR